MHEAASSPKTRMVWTGVSRSAGSVVPSANAAQEFDIARAEGVDPAVEHSGLRRGGAARGRAAPRQPARGARQACADRAAAHYDEIVLHEGL